MAVFTFIFYKMNPQILENALVEINTFNAKDVDKTPAEVTANAEKIKRNIYTDDDCNNNRKEHGIGRTYYNCGCRFSISKKIGIMCLSIIQKKLHIYLKTKCVPIAIGITEAEHCCFFARLTKK